MLGITTVRRTLDIYSRIFMIVQGSIELAEVFMQLLMKYEIKS